MLIASLPNLDIGVEVKVYKHKIHPAFDFVAYSVHWNDMDDDQELGYQGKLYTDLSQAMTFAIYMREP